MNMTKTATGLGLLWIRKTEKNTQKVVSVTDAKITKTTPSNICYISWGWS
jgi:hypothetical protein